MNTPRIPTGIIGTGGIGYASAAWLAHQGFPVHIWSPGGSGARGLEQAPLQASGVLDAQLPVAVAPSLDALATAADVLLIAVPVNAHRQLFDALVPRLRHGQTVVVSSMGSLSALYLAEQTRQRGLQVTVASMGTTTLTARRTGPAAVRIMTRRSRLGLSALPQSAGPQALALCQSLFGDVFTLEANALASALTNINPVAHGPLALFNWTRIERGEHWPQYHYMTPHVASVIEALDSERRALARAFGLEVRSIEEHFAKSFGTRCERLADIAAELHAQRGGPPGPTEVRTRFLTEDVPYGLVFSRALGRMAGLSMPATEAVIQAANLITGNRFENENDLIEPLRLPHESPQGLLQRLQ